MKGLKFANFVTDANNEAAFMLCERIARLDKDVAGPVTLVGEKGTGKSHLLWSIVNSFRESQTRVAIALISAADFPQKVRNLAKDSAPIQRRRPAVLLVDELELFKEDAGELEAVARAFMENGHLVVAATRVHPTALSQYSGKFKSMLSAGTIVGLQATEAARAGEDAAQGGVPQFALDHIASLKKALAEAETARDRLRATLDDAMKSGGDQITQMESLREAAAKAEAERDRARAALEKSEGELLEMRSLAEAARENEEAMRAELDAAAERIGALAQRLTVQQEAQRARVRALGEALAAAMRDMEALAQGSPLEGSAAVAAYDALAAEKQAVEAEMDDLRHARRGLESALEDTRRNLAEQAATLSQLRGVEAAQLARASVWAGELQSLLDKAADGLKPAVAGKIAEVRDRLASVAQVLSGGGAGFDGGGDAPAALPVDDDLAAQVREAFGDPSDEDDDDITWAEPILDDDEAGEEDGGRGKK